MAPINPTESMKPLPGGENELMGPIQGSDKDSENPFERREGQNNFPPSNPPSIGKDHLDDLKSKVREDKPPIKSPAEKPTIFSGTYGSAKARNVLFKMGSEHGWKDYKWVANPTVRKEMQGFDKKFFEGKSYVSKRDRDIIITRLNKEISYYSGAKRMAAEQWRERLKNL